MPPRVLALVATTSYRTDDLVAAARRLGVDIAVGTDRCHELAKLWPEAAFGTVEVWLRDPYVAVEQIRAAAAERPFDAIVPTDEQTAYVAALAAAQLGIQGNSFEAVYRAKNKAEMRRALAAAQVPCPSFSVFDLTDDPVAVAARIEYPCVLKPLLLSTSRGVMRANDPEAFVVAWQRLRAILETPALRAVDDPAGHAVLVERFVAGEEVALEGILEGGRLQVLALFDKPDPLDGPFFEETIYVTPSVKSPALQDAIARVAEEAALAIGLTTGPIHAELRIEDTKPIVIEVAARSIGGLCARTLRFGLGAEGRSLEEIVLEHALGRGTPISRLEEAAGVMMIPVPAAGVLQAVGGVEAAKAVALVEDVVITARAGETLVPPPEGASYPGFIFARGGDPEQVVAALKQAHAALRFEIARKIS